MRTIKLYGELGKKYGRVHRLAVRTPAEAIRALSANFKTFRSDLETAHLRGIGYRVRNGRTELDNVKQIRDPAAQVIQITPAIIGANAESRILIGVAIIAAVVLTGGVGAVGVAGLLANVATGIGVSLVLGGISQLLSPSPETQATPERPENTPSYTFNGPVNTTAQGHPVPVGYGRLIVGGAVISAGISLEQTKEGFYKTKTERTRIVSLLYGTNTPTLGSPAIPGNWYKRVFLGIGFSGLQGSYQNYEYYYYEWTLHDL